MKKVAFYTLGCKLNFSESSTLARQLGDKGFIQVPFESTPDVFVINTCSVTENADKKCRKVVRSAQKISPKAYIAIVGCYAQLKPKEISQIPGVDVVLGASEKFQQVVTMSPQMPDELSIAIFNMEKPAQLADLIATNLPIPIEVRQNLRCQNVPTDHRQIRRRRAQGWFFNHTFDRHDWPVLAANIKHTVR